MNDEPNDTTEPLVGYALEFLTRHIQLVKEALFFDEGKIEGPMFRIIAKRLVDLFGDVEAIEKFWDTTEEIHESWWNPDNVKSIGDFIKDDRTIAQLEPRERR